jgi:hypothetical protein
VGTAEGKQRVACWIHDQLAIGDMFTSSEHGRPLANSLQVAVETNDGLYLIVPSKSDTRESRISVYSVRASNAAGEQRNRLFQVPPGVNPFPGVGEPAYPGGPLATKTHAVVAWVHSVNQAGAMGARMMSSGTPLQKAREVLDSLSKNKPVAVPSAPPVATPAVPSAVVEHASQLVEPAKIDISKTKMWGTPEPVTGSALAPPPIPGASNEPDLDANEGVRPAAGASQQLAVTLHKTGVKKGLQDPDAHEPSRLINWSHR